MTTHELIAGFVVLTSLSSGNVVGAPRLRLDTDRHDFGQVLQGVTVEQRFRVKNVGDAPLEIEMIRPSCAPCAAAMVRGSRIGPGQSDELKVSYHAKVTPGRHTAFLMIHSNDPVEPIKKISLSITVLSAKGVPRLRCEPAGLDLGILAQGEKPTARIALSNPKDAKEPLLLKQIYASRGCTVGDAKPRRIAPGGTELLALRVNVGKRGILQEHIEITTNDPITPVVSIPITGYVAKEGEGRGTTASGGVTIAPLGEAVPLPGSGGEFAQKLLVENSTTRVVRVRFPVDGKSLARARPAELTLEAGEKGVVELELAPDMVGKTESIRIEVDYPVIIQRGENETTVSPQRAQRAQRETEEATTELPDKTPSPQK